MRKTRETEAQSAENTATSTYRKPYRAPKVETFGHVRDLTMTGVGSVTDGAVHRNGGG